MARWYVRAALAGIFLVGAASGALGTTLLRHIGNSLAHAQTGACSNASLNGTYGALGRGFSLTGPDGSPLAVPQPQARLNVVTVDGAGNYSRTGTINVGGVVTPNPAAGTYTVSPDCSFTLTIALPNGGAAHAAGVLVDGGKRAYVITTDPSAVQDFIWERQ